MMEDSQYINGFAQWQPDEDMQNCLNCQSKFSFMIRKHHCRCCGCIFCATCSDNFVKYDTTYVRVVKRWPTDDQFAPYRTCESCFKNLSHQSLLLNMSRKRILRVGRDLSREVEEEQEDSLVISEETEIDESESISARTVNIKNSLAETGMNVTTLDNTYEDTQKDIRQDESEQSHCPICNMSLTDLTDELECQKHVQECIEAATNVRQHQNSLDDASGARNLAVFKNRMLVFKMDQQNSTDGELNKNLECPICFDDMVPGDKIGRLECLCVFHYDCIKSWFKKKSQLIKSKDSKLVNRNFCPLHDAIY